MPHPPCYLDDEGSPLCPQCWQEDLFNGAKTSNRSAQQAAGVRSWRILCVRPHTALKAIQYGNFKSEKIQDPFSFVGHSGRKHKVQVRQRRRVGGRWGQVPVGVKGLSVDKVGISALTSRGHQKSWKERIGDKNNSLLPGSSEETRNGTIGWKRD